MRDEVVKQWKRRLWRQGSSVRLLREGSGACNHDSFIVPVGDQLVLAGSSIFVLESGEDAPKLVARLDLAGG